MKHYPVFVYGTLMSGLYNHKYIIKNRGKMIGKATLRHFGMWSVYRDLFPAIYPYENKLVIGEVYEFPAKYYKQAIEDLDYLESNGYMYYRVLVDVKLDTGETITVWTYVYIRHQELIWHISNGDWRAYYNTLLKRGKKKIQKSD